jgi:bifunctional UDP-N-acetylglucosamine pyrophosphorylase/glucosamine-1-phosphate N-acetyltransferase
MSVDMKQTSCVVLAAGKGTRMKSAMAKVLHEVFFAPMIYHVLDAVSGLPLDQTIVVVGHQREKVEQVLDNYSVSFAHQKEQAGTGHAVLCAKEMLAARGGTILILCGDTPLIRTETLAKMFVEHEEKKAELTLMTTRLEDPTHYGRIICDDEGNVVRIAEEKDASSFEKSIQEINAGIYLAEAQFLFLALDRVGSDNSQGEVYLTDIVELANQQGHKVNRFAGVNAEEVLGVNSRVELAEAHRSLQRRRNRELMLSGVTIINPESVAVEKGVVIRQDTVIGPNAIITGSTHIGNRCRIEANTNIHNSHLGDDVVVDSFSCLRDCQIASGEYIVPFTIKNQTDRK